MSAIAAKYMKIRICKICKKEFNTKSFYILLCSNECRILSKKYSSNKYKKSTKGYSAKKRWQNNPKRKEILKRHMKLKGNKTAVKRITRLINTIPYYKAMKILRSTKQYKDLRNELISQFGMCACCHSDKSLTIDHIIPTSLGGKHEIDNLQVLCRSCNSRKKQETIKYELPKMQ